MKKGGKIVAIILAIVAALSAVGVGILGVFSFKVDDVKRTHRDKYEYRDSDSRRTADEVPYEDPYSMIYVGIIIYFSQSLYKSIMHVSFQVEVFSLS